VGENGFNSAYWCVTCRVIIDGLDAYDKDQEYAEGELKEYFLDEWNKAHEQK
jgi:hypothetical protein